MGGDANQVDDERNRRASIFLPINSLKMANINTFRFDVSKHFGDSIDLKYTRFGPFATCWGQDSLWNYLEFTLKIRPGISISI